MTWPCRVLDRLAKPAEISQEISTSVLHYTKLPAIVRVSWPRMRPLPARPRLWLYGACDFGQMWYGSPLTFRGIIAAVGVALPLLLLDFLGGAAQHLRDRARAMRIVGGPPAGPTAMAPVDTLAMIGIGHVIAHPPHPTMILFDRLMAPR